MLLQSRASRISDVLTLKDVDEIAESPPGAVQDAVMRKIREEIKEIGVGTKPPIASTDAPTPARPGKVVEEPVVIEKSIEKSIEKPTIEKAANKVGVTVQ